MRYRDYELRIEGQYLYYGPEPVDFLWLPGKIRGLHNYIGLLYIQSDGGGFLLNGVSPETFCLSALTRRDEDHVWWWIRTTSEFQCTRPKIQARKARNKAKAPSSTRASSMRYVLRFISAPP